MKQFFKTAIAAVAAVIMIAVVAVPAFAATPAPDFSSGDYVDLLPYMKETLYGKQEDEEDGKRLDLTKKSSGFTVKYNSQAVNYGVRFNYDFLKADGTLYTSCTLDADQDLWDSDNARIYGGQVIELGYGTIVHGDTEYFGYFSLLFTEQDGIDLRFSDKIGNDLVYLGAITTGLKVAYPSGSMKRGDKDLKVITAMSKKAISVWVDGVAVIDNIEWGNLYNSSGKKINCNVEHFSPGTHANATRTSVFDYRLYCKKADATVKVTDTQGTASSNGGSSNNTSGGSSNTSGGSSNTSGNATGNNDTSSDKSEADDNNNQTDSIVDELIAGGEVEAGDASKDYILVRGDKVEYFNWQTPVFITLGSALLLGAVIVVVYVLISKNK